MAGIYNSSYTALVVLSRTDFCQWRFPLSNLKRLAGLSEPLDLRAQTSREGHHFSVAAERQMSTPSRKLRTICEIKEQSRAETALNEKFATFISREWDVQQFLGSLET
jgi:hypothetical protein